MKLSIVITTLSDNDLPNTVQSIRDTAGDKPEIIIVSDGAPLPTHTELLPSNIKTIVNSKRVGVGPSRTIGALHATGDSIMLLDSHCRFLPGWYEKTLAHLEARPKTLFCFECRGLDKEHMDVLHPVSLYYGATWRVFGPDPNTSKTQIFEAVWNKGVVANDSEIPCVMGGAYAASREWMLQVAMPLRHLQYWSDDETVLSMQSWGLGGDVRIITDTGIGHRFYHQQSGEKQPFTVPVGAPTYNRLLSIHTLLPDDLRDFCLEKMQLHQGGGELSVAKKMIEQNWRVVETERAINQTRFVRDFNWLKEKFNL